MHRCLDCGSEDTEVRMQVDRGGGFVRFAVECSGHGGFSHFLEQDEQSHAVRAFLREAPTGECFRGAMELLSKAVLARPRVKVHYTNHRGERSEREIVPLLLSFTDSEWHGKTYTMFVYDCGKKDYRLFDLRKIEW